MSTVPFELPGPGQLYKLNGRWAHDPDNGWILTDATEYHLGTTITRPESRLPGFDGMVEMDGVENAPALNLTWVVDESKLGGLMNLLRAPELYLEKHDVGGAYVDLGAIVPRRIGIGDDPAYEVAVTLSIPGIWLRGPEVTETVDLTAAQMPITFLEGMTGKVSDGVIYLYGPLSSGVRIQDIAGQSWMQVDYAISTNSVVRFDMALGRAWVTNAATPDAAGTEVTQHVRTGPSPYPLRLTPTVASPTAATAPKLMVSSAGRAATSRIALTARPAYVL